MAWKETTQVKYKYLKFVLKYCTWVVPSYTALTEHDSAIQ